ncbi:MAG: glycosyltransferase family 2 protein, partial [Pirellulaceae bacterium]|nr:glycosyltransferase family 2 protein [Pirellulaceae bacterium]
MQNARSSAELTLSSAAEPEVFRESEVAASVIITSRNRCADVLRAVASCFAQQGTTLEVLVFDDASDDGTVDRVRQTFPNCRVFGNTERQGYIINRNRGFLEARGPVVFSLDDDAYFSDVDI